MRTKEFFLQERENELIREMEVQEAERYEFQKQEYFKRKEK